VRTIIISIIEMFISHS